jgi:hypothetical protein
MKNMLSILAVDILQVFYLIHPIPSNNSMFEDI